MDLPVPHLAIVHRTPAVDASANDHEERRTSARLPVSKLPWLGGVRLKFGPMVTVIDLSAGGIQIETANYRMQPGSTIVLEIGSPNGDMTVPASVLRCHVTGIGPAVLYRGGLAFKRTIEFPDEARRQDMRAQAPEHADPIHEHERLTMALLRRIGVPGAEQPPSPFSLAGDAGVIRGHLIQALGVLGTPAGRRGGQALAMALASLFRAAAGGAEAGLGAGALRDQVVHHLRRVVPANVIRLVAATQAQGVLKAEPLYFDVRAEGRDGAARLLIDLSPAAPLDEWQFTYLKAAAHVLSAIGDSPRPAAEPDTAPVAPSAAVRPDWHKVVVRYADGHVVKGFSQHFTASSGALTVWPQIDAPASARITVPIAHLKAVFIVRDFEGNPSRVDGSAQPDAAHGRRLVVTFLDGETLSGTTLSYSPSAPAFFLRPDDATGNNLRVLIAARSVRHVQWA